MSSSKSGNSQAAKRYAKALFELALESDVAAIEKDLVAFSGLVAGSNPLDTLIHSPVISREEKEKALSAILEKAGSHKLIRQFVAVLARNNRLPLLSSVIEAFLDQLRAYRKELVAEVTAATPLQAESITAISKALTEALGKKVNVTVVVDKEILGGMIVKIGSVMLDNSLKSKLDRLGRIGDNVTLSQAA